jgi:hypothetical protein
MWTPEREDLLIELAGTIDDEDTSLVERAEERANRFDDYRDNRLADATSAEKGVRAIMDGIPPGQPIFVGHHSEARSRRDKKRIDSGMRRAVHMWETAEYWQQSAAGALRHAKYKERPAVRARRIKRIEADLRKAERNRAQAVAALAAWSATPMPIEKARRVANYNSFPCVKREGTWALGARGTCCSPTASVTTPAHLWPSIRCSSSHGSTTRRSSRDWTAGSPTIKAAWPTNAPCLPMTAAPSPSKQLDSIKIPDRRLSERAELRLVLPDTR